MSGTLVPNCAPKMSQCIDSVHALKHSNQAAWRRWNHWFLLSHLLHQVIQIQPDSVFSWMKKLSESCKARAPCKSCLWCFNMGKTPRSQDRACDPWIEQCLEGKGHAALSCTSCAICAIGTSTSWQTNITQSKRKTCANWNKKKLKKPQTWQLV